MHDQHDDSSAQESSMRIRESRFPRPRTAAAAAALFLGLAAVPVAAGAGPAAAATSTATVSVSAGQALATVPSTAIGTNGSVYDAALTDAAVPGLLKNAGTGLIRFPGGTSSDTYNWKTNTDVKSGLAQSVDFDQYATLLSQSGAQGMITVNYGTGDTMGASQ